ncbi:hypothetical protein, partial [Salmonella sp. s54395]|uniref:hypothetical protein n=1 Tax=Salmonella sp. s54395 TaxID=3159664 RepID=UPI0039804C98
STGAFGMREYRPMFQRYSNHYYRMTREYISCQTARRLGLLTGIVNGRKEMLNTSSIILYLYIK